MLNWVVASVEMFLERSGIYPANLMVKSSCVRLLDETPYQHLKRLFQGSIRLSGRKRLMTPTILVQNCFYPEIQAHSPVVTTRLVSQSTSREQRNQGGA